MAVAEERWRKLGLKERSRNLTVQERQQLGWSTERGM